MVLQRVKRILPSGPQAGKETKTRQQVQEEFGGLHTPQDPFEQKAIEFVQMYLSARCYGKREQGIEGME